MAHLDAINPSFGEKLFKEAHHPFVINAEKENSYFSFRCLPFMIGMAVEVVTTKGSCPPHLKHALWLSREVFICFFLSLQDF